ncbi:MAG: RHS repeat-associated core domain-containing protein [Chloroflexi bacterium]|nr:RHS repeat-associated core domain-containing protein [Chloroflexota bacterium]
MEVKKGTAIIASFVYDGDGRRVKSTEYPSTGSGQGITTTFVGAHYELTNGTVTKYYFAGTSRIAMGKYTTPEIMKVEYFLSDHLGSTSISTDTAGVKVSEMRYKPWGEVRYAWTNAPANTSPAYALTRYTFTGQYSHMDDPSTPASEGFGLMHYGARMYDPALGRFTSADTIVPGGVQGYDRYAYVNNSPVNYTDPSGHEPKYGEGACYEINCKNANGTDVVHGNGKGGKPKGVVEEVPEGEEIRIGDELFLTQDYDGNWFYNSIQYTYSNISGENVDKWISNLSRRTPLFEFLFDMVFDLSPKIPNGTGTATELVERPSRVFTIAVEDFYFESNRNGEFDVVFTTQLADKDGLDNGRYAVSIHENSTGHSQIIAMYEFYFSYTINTLNDVLK